MCYGLCCQSCFKVVVFCRFSWLAERVLEDDCVYTVCEAVKVLVVVCWPAVTWGGGGAGRLLQQGVTTGAGEVRGAWVKLLFGFKLMQAGDGLGRFSDTGHMICVACMVGGGKWFGGMT